MADARSQLLPAHLALLADQQNSLLNAIFAPRATASAFAPSRGLAAYRANAHASAERALQAAYPVMVQLLGEEDFNNLARDFWHQCPPQRGDLAQWGAALPAFLSGSESLADTPYLADVAHIEWALHTCADAADRLQNAASFANLKQHEPKTLSFLLAPGAAVLACGYPAATVVLAHQGHGSLTDAAALLHAGSAQSALVWRQGYAPRLRVLHETETAATRAICAGQSIEHALNLAHPDFDFSAWLTANVQNGLLLGTAVHP